MIEATVEIKKAISACMRELKQIKHIHAEDWICQGVYKNTDNSLFLEFNNPIAEEYATFNYYFYKNSVVPMHIDSQSNIVCSSSVEESLTIWKSFFKELDELSRSKREREVH